MFSRLEAREILRNLGPDCDEEVVAKLQSIAGSKQVSVSLAMSPQPFSYTTFGVEQQIPISTPPRSDVDQMNRADYGHLNDQEYDALVRTRKAEEQRAQVRATTLGYEQLAPTVVPKSSTQRLIEVGATNSVGDKCVGRNGDNFSVYQCPQGHGYIANNPAIKGCTACALLGNASSNREEANEQPQAKRRIDPGAIAGEDSNW